MLVKICGISNEIDAMNAIKHWADAIWFVMWWWVLPVEVEPRAQYVRQIIKKFPANVDSFLVTHLMEVDEILDLANYINCTWIQISEDIWVEKVKQIRELTNKKIIKTVKVLDERSFENLKLYQEYADFILLDTFTWSYVGWTGQLNDWDLGAQLVKASSKPVYLAGWLTPGNVVEWIQKVNPTWTDVSTWVSAYWENYHRKDRKDEQKIKDFITLSKKW